MKVKLRTFLMMGQALLVFSCVTLAGPPNGRANLVSHSRKSGIEGQVLLRTCFLAYPSGESCEEAPYQAQISVYTEGGRLVTTFITDPDGAFSLSVRPGRYVLVPFVATSEGPGGTTSVLFPIANPVSVKVEGHEFSEVAIVYDSGSL
jgi:hypothetical protein